MKKTKRINITLSEDLITQIDLFKKEWDFNRSNVISLALKQYFENESIRKNVGQPELFGKMIVDVIKNSNLEE